jgi:hypothetical protein
MNASVASSATVTRKLPASRHWRNLTTKTAAESF